MGDREIVAAIVAGDLAGLAAAYDEHAASLYGYCRWMLGEPEDAADAVEETFVIAAGRLDGLRDPRKLRPWLSPAPGTPTPKFTSLPPTPTPTSTATPTATPTDPGTSPPATTAAPTVPAQL